MKKFLLYLFKEFVSDHFIIIYTTDYDKQSRKIEFKVDSCGLEPKKILKEIIKTL